MSLLVRMLAVTRGARSILSDASFGAPAGRITGLIGPNGAGKSTLLSALLGLVPATGEAAFEGKNLPSMHRRDRARCAAFVEQSANTEERLSVLDVVSLGRLPFQSALSPGLSLADEEIIAAALAETGMTRFRLRRFDTLSGGEQQRVHIARALAQEPRLLLLDEPTSHLDIGAQMDLFALLRRRADAGMTVVMALHDLNLATRCDHLVILKDGRTMGEGAPPEVLTPAVLQAAYGVVARILNDPFSSRPVIVYDENYPSNPD